MIFRMAFLSKGVSTGPPYLGLIAWEIEVAVKKIAVSKIEIAVSKLEIAVNFYFWSNFIVPLGNVRWLYDGGSEISKVGL